MLTYNYSNCSSIQTANLFLSQTTLDLYQILSDINRAHISNGKPDYSSKASEIVINDPDGPEEWCILQ